MRGIMWAIAGAGLAMATPAIAQPIIVADSGDTAWVLACALIGLLASLGGFALFHGRASARALVAGSAIGALIFAVFGYSLVFGDGSELLGSASNLMLGNLGDVVEGATISEIAFVAFELAVALFALGALTSAVAPGARIGWLIPFSALWFTLVYLPVARWTWAGWLGDLGAFDYAGGLAVQLPAGLAAFIVGLLLRNNDTAADIVAERGLAGAALLATAWLAIIGGSALGASDDAATSVVNALLAASAAVVTGMVVGAVRQRAFDGGTAAIHAFAGLAAISAGASLVGVGGAMALGLLAALAATGATALTSALGLKSGGTAFAMHGAPAIVGALLFPVFMLPAFGGPDFAEGSSLGAALAAQGIAVLAVALWTAVATVIAALIVSFVVPMKPAA